MLRYNIAMVDFASHSQKKIPIFKARYLPRKEKSMNIYLPVRRSYECIAPLFWRFVFGRYSKIS